MQKINIPNVKNVIAVLSGKGGVGKTFIATNLALSLAKLGKKTCLLDADIHCPNVFQLLGLPNKMDMTAEKQIIPLERFGVKVVSMAGLASEDEPIMWRGPLISKILQQLLLHSLWGEAEFLIIDAAGSTSDSVVTMLQNFEIHGTIIVTGPQELSLMDAKRTLHMLISLKTPVLGIVENLRGEIFGEGGGSRLASKYNLPLLASIPMRSLIAQGCDDGKPAILHSEELDMIFSRLARNILERVVVS